MHVLARRNQSSAMEASLQLAIVVSTAKFIGECRTPRQEVHQLLAWPLRSILICSMGCRWLDNHPSRQVQRERTRERRFAPVVAYPQ